MDVVQIIEYNYNTLGPHLSLRYKPFWKSMWFCLPQLDVTPKLKPSLDIFLCYASLENHTVSINLVQILRKINQFNTT